jgi:predicted site-specific integrase-resolvase
MQKAAIYARVSTPDRHIETQLYQLRELAGRRGFEVVCEYQDRGSSVPRPAGRGLTHSRPTPAARCLLITSAVASIQDCHKSALSRGTVVR